MIVFVTFVVLLLSGLNFANTIPDEKYPHRNNHTNECKAQPHADIMSMLRLIDRYRRMHGWGALLSESPDQLCRRRFLNSVWRSTCDSIGNGIQPPLNAIVDAIILNYTVVLTPMQCGGDLEWADWLVMLKPLEVLLTSAGCPTDLRTRFDINEEPHLNPPTRCELMYNLTSPRVITLSAGHISDPDPDIDNEEIEGTNNGGWSGNDYYNNAYDLFRPDDVRNAMHGDYLIRAQITFGTGNEGDPRFRFHGALARKTLSFSENITHPVHALLGPRRCLRDLVIAVHSRHFDVQTEDESSKLDQGFVRAVTELVSELRHANFSCRILLASDRPHMLRLFNISDIGCEVIVNHFHIETSSANRSITSEHGLFTQSQMVLKDVYLLSQANYFVGSLGSTFSSLIQNFIAFHALTENITFLTSTFITRNGDVNLLKGFKPLRESVNGGRLRGSYKQGLDCRHMWNHSNSKTGMYGNRAGMTRQFVQLRS